MNWRQISPLMALSTLVWLSIASLGLTGGDGPERPANAHQEGQASLIVPFCTTVAAGETFEFPIYASNMEDLLAWEVYFSYNRDILEVTDRDVQQLLSQSDGSRVFDFSDPVPNTKGLYRMAAADLGGAGSTETGSGILAFLTLRAKDAGVSDASLARLDFNDDGVDDLGPVLTRLGGDNIGDLDGDPNGIFDGPLTSGQIAVDTVCVTPGPPPGSQTAPSADGQPSAPGATPSEAGSPGPDDGSGDGNGEDPAGTEDQPTDTLSAAELAATPGAPATATATAVAEAMSTPGSGADIDPQSPSSGSGISIWLIVVGFGVAGVGLITTLAVIRATRRRLV